MSALRPPYAEVDGFAYEEADTVAGALLMKRLIQLPTPGDA